MPAPGRDDHRAGLVPQRAAAARVEQPVQKRQRSAVGRGIIYRGNRKMKPSQAGLFFDGLIYRIVAKNTALCLRHCRIRCSRGSPLYRYGQIPFPHRQPPARRQPQPAQCRYSPSHGGCRLTAVLSFKHLFAKSGAPCARNHGLDPFRSRRKISASSSDMS